MDIIESATNSFLLSHGPGEVMYEPRGKNSAPDFSLNGTIGIEATRLVQLLKLPGGTINLTEEEPRVWQTFEKAIHSIKNVRFSGSYFVCIEYAFPINVRTCAKVIGSYLRTLACSTDILKHKTDLSENLRIEVYPCSGPLDTPFFHGGSNCVQGGGFVLGGILEQSREAIDRKRKKIIPIFDQFDEWWLAVASDLTIGVEDSYLEVISAELRESGPWSKLLLINLNNPERSRMISLLSI